MTTLRPRRCLIGGIILSVVVGGAPPSPGNGLNGPDDLRRTDLSGFPPPPKRARLKIESSLLDQIRDAAAERTGADVRRAGRTGGDSGARVVIESVRFGRFSAGRPAVTAVRHHVEMLGGRAEAAYGNLVQAFVPWDSIELLAASPLVSLVRPPYSPKPETYITEGVIRTGADRWRTLSAYRTPGRKVKIGVIDLGFKGYGALLGTELPSDTRLRSFRFDGNLEAETDHGAACAEIIHDMAPDASLYLVNFATDVEHHAAVDYLVNERVDIISYSLGWTGVGAGDGTGPICDDVKKCAAADILGVGAAGDEAESHWEATFADANVDSFHDFAGDDEILQWWVPANTWTSASLEWDDWGVWDGTSFGKPDQDYDLLLWRRTGTAWELLQVSDNWQTGESGQKPHEETSLWRAGTGAYYGVSILKFNASRSVRLELVVRGNSGPIEYNVSSGSLTIPADAAEAIAVGATDWNTDELFGASSRGPTRDGRVKPDLTAPAGVSTATYGAFSFAGTSAAAPHVAGALGLLLSRLPYPPAQARKILESRAIDLGSTGKDNLYGFGRLTLIK